VSLDDIGSVHKCIASRLAERNLLHGSSTAAVHCRLHVFCCMLDPTWEGCNIFGAASVGFELARRLSNALKGCILREPLWHWSCLSTCGLSPGRDSYVGLRGEVAVHCLNAWVAHQERNIILPGVFSWRAEGSSVILASIGSFLQGM